MTIARQVFDRLGIRRHAVGDAHDRRVLARSLREIVHELEGPPLPDDAPLNRTAARPNVDLLRALAERLDDLDRPVSPEGVLLVQELLTDGIESPLYTRGQAADVRPALERCLVALEPRPADQNGGAPAAHVEVGAKADH